MAIEQQDRHQQAKHAKRDANIEAQKELNEQNLIKMQTLRNTLASSYGKVIDAVTGLMAMGLADPSLDTARAKIRGVRKTNDPKQDEQKEKEERQAKEALTTDTLVENQNILENAVISGAVLDPTLVYLNNLPISNDGVPQAAIEQFATANYGPNTLDLTSLQRSVGSGRIVVAVDIIRQVFYEFLIEAMKRRIPPDELFEVWMKLVNLDLFLPEVNKISDGVIDFLKDKITAEEFALTSCAGLSARIVADIKEAYKGSILGKRIDLISVVNGEIECVPSSDIVPEPFAP